MADNKPADIGAVAGRSDSFALTLLMLRNFRGFEHFTTTLHPRATVFVAPSGGGKSACLGGAARALGVLRDALQGTSFRVSSERLSAANQDPDLRVVQAQPTDSAQTPTGVGLSLSADVSVPHLAMAADQGSVSAPPTLTLTPQNEQSWRNWAELHRAHGSATLPVLRFFGALRGRATQHGTHVGGRTDQDPQQRDGLRAYENCLDPHSDAEDWQAQFTSWCRMAPQHGTAGTKVGNEASIEQASQCVEAVRAAVGACLKPGGWEGLSYSAEHDTLVIARHEHSTLRIDQLSDGPRSILHIAGDVSVRAAQLNPQLGARSNESPGMILIDEVEAHLHPSWQQDVLPTLLATFPNMQFIMATHSPQVLSSLHRETIRIITRIPADNEPACTAANFRGVMPDVQVYAQPASTALQRVLGASPTPVQLPEYQNIELLMRQLRDLTLQGGAASGSAQDVRRRLQELGYEVPQAKLRMWETMAELSPPP